MLLRSVVYMLSVFAKLEWLVKADCEACLAPSSTRPGLMALIESGVSLPLLVLTEFPLVTRYFSPRKPSPSDFGLRSFLNLSDKRGDGGGIIGEEGGLSFSVTVLLELGGPGYCALMSGSSRMACTPGGIRNGLFPRASRPANACSELAEILSMCGTGSTGDGLKPCEVGV
jgi:hypothetical protein